VAWRLLAEGRRTYTATLPGARRFEGLLASFTACVQAMGVPVAWMRCRHLHLLAAAAAPLLALPTPTPTSLTHGQKLPLCEKIIVVAKDHLAGPVVAMLRGVYQAPDVLEVLGSFEGITVASVDVVLSAAVGAANSGKGVATPGRGAPPPLSSLGGGGGGAPVVGSGFTAAAADKKADRLEELYNENLSALSWTIAPATANTPSQVRERDADAGGGLGRACLFVWEPLLTPPVRVVVHVHPLATGPCRCLRRRCAPGCLWACPRGWWARSSAPTACPPTPRYVDSSCTCTSQHCDARSARRLRVCWLGATCVDHSYSPLAHRDT
jgi:hypothetical protein